MPGDRKPYTLLVLVLVPLLATVMGAIPWASLMIAASRGYRSGAIPAPFGAFLLINIAVWLVTGLALLGYWAIPVPFRSPVGAAASVLLLWPATVLITTAAHGLNPRYLVIEATSTGVWIVLFGASVLAMTAFMRRSLIWPAIAIVVIGAFVAIDLALIVDSALIYDVAGYWTLDDGVPLPYSYAAFWYPASILPLDSFFGVSQEAITARDFEWQEEHILPVALTLTAVTAFAVGYLLRAGRRLSAH